MRNVRSMLPLVFQNSSEIQRNIHQSDPENGVAFERFTIIGGNETHYRRVPRKLPLLPTCNQAQRSNRLSTQREGNLSVGQTNQQTRNRDGRGKKKSLLTTYAKQPRAYRYQCGRSRGRRSRRKKSTKTTHVHLHSFCLP